MKKVGNVTLEMSLKPFRQLNQEYVEQVCCRMFMQWKGIVDRAEVVSVLLWIADGSEILDYRGREQDELEWARYIGGANPKQSIPNDPQGRALHSRFYLYMENPPVITYGDLKRIVSIIKRIGEEVTSKPVRVGATFDPGPEFARSPFKYERHPEICQAGTMGKGQHRFVTCYTHLHADDVSYAGFPDGIEEGTPLGMFLGRQSQCFLDDMGFDYLWLSNGFGFGKETWGTTGDLFDGYEFSGEKAHAIAEAIKEFWVTFRRECPDYPLETRGTNLSTGIDLASDATPYAWLNSAGLNFAPAPNSPWAALDGDFGLELMGYMSHIAELPADAEGYPFRFYTHDPWWLNSPWLDRYGRQPHDIYLPMSVSRITAQGDVENPESVEFLTVDDSFGEMPDTVPDEVIPHVLQGMEDAPDCPGPLVWVYPFDESHKDVFGDVPDLSKPFYGDWFMRGAINNGLPVNTVVSDSNFLASVKSRPEMYQDSVIVTALPQNGALAETLCQLVRSGGTVLFYGPCQKANGGLLEMMNVKPEASIAGELGVQLSEDLSGFDGVILPDKLIHRELLCAGGCGAVLADDTDADTETLARVSDGSQQRIAAMIRSHSDWNGGRIAWVRGTVSASLPEGYRLLVPDNPQELLLGESLMRLALSKLGISIHACKTSSSQRTPVITMARSKGGLFLSAYSPNTNVGVRLRMPMGAPLFTGMETVLRQGHSEYRFPRAWHGECRVLVDQADDGELQCVEVFSGEIGVRRRICVRGLKDATLRFLVEPGSEESLTFRRPDMLYRDDLIIPHQCQQSAGGEVAMVENVSGDVMVSW